MTLLNLHWYSRDLPYRGSPDKLTYTGTYFEAFYNGFLDCSQACPKSYDPLRLYGYTFCCGSIPAMLVWVEQGTRRRPKFKSDAITVFYEDKGPLGKFITFPGGECPEIAEFSFDLASYQQSLASSSEFESVSGFGLAQTTFWDFENVCPEELTKREYALAYMYEDVMFADGTLLYDDDYLITVGTGNEIIQGTSFRGYAVKEIEAVLTLGYIDTPTVMESKVYRFPCTPLSQLNAGYTHFLGIDPKGTGWASGSWTGCGGGTTPRLPQQCDSTYGKIISTHKQVYALFPIKGRLVQVNNFGTTNGSLSYLTQEQTFSYDTSVHQYNASFLSVEGITNHANNRMVSSYYEIGTIDVKTQEREKLITVIGISYKSPLCPTVPDDSTEGSPSDVWRYCISARVSLEISLVSFTVGFKVRTKTGTELETITAVVTAGVPIFEQELYCYETSSRMASVEIASFFLEEITAGLGDIILTALGPIGVALGKVVSINLTITENKL